MRTKNVCCKDRLIQGLGDEGAGLPQKQSSDWLPVPQSASLYYAVSQPSTKANNAGTGQWLSSARYANLLLIFPKPLKAQSWGGHVGIRGATPAAAARAASPVSATARKSTIAPGSALWSGGWTWSKRFLPVLYSSYWRMRETWSACKSSRKICLVQALIGVKAWFEVSRGSPTGVFSTRAVRNLHKMGSRQFCSPRPRELSSLPSLNLRPSPPEEAAHGQVSTVTPLVPKTLLHMICSNLALLLMIASSLLLKFCSLGRASSMHLY